jgi:hypothetical protein
MRSFRTIMKESKADQQRDKTEQKRLHIDFGINKEMAEWFCDFWQPKADLLKSKSRIQIIQNKLNISWSEFHPYECRYAHEIKFDMSNDQFRHQSTQCLERANVMKGKP